MEILSGKFQPTGLSAPGVIQLQLMRVTPALLFVYLLRYSTLPVLSNLTSPGVIQLQLMRVTPALPFLYLYPGTGTLRYRVLSNLTSPGVNQL
jgi:hypothetical protein